MEEKSVAALILGLRSARSAVRYEAASELVGATYCEKDVSAAVPALIRALGDGDWRVRMAAVDALVKIGPPAVPALIGALGDKDSGVRMAAVHALWKIGLPAVPALVKVLWHDDWLVRMAAVDALVKIGPPAVPALIEALGDKDSGVSMAAVRALGKIGLPAVPALIRALGDGDSNVRMWAAGALANIGPRDYRDLDLIVLSGGKLKKEGEDFSHIMELHSKWVEIMNQRANAIINDKSFHVPKVKKRGRGTDKMERVLRVRRSCA